MNLPSHCRLAGPFPRALMLEKGFLRTLSKEHTLIRLSDWTVQNWKNSDWTGHGREQGVDKEDLANEIRRRIGCIRPLRGSVTCFCELFLSTLLYVVLAWSLRGGFDFVDLKCAGNNCVVTPILAYFETKFFNLLINKIYKIPPPTNQALNQEL